MATPITVRLTDQTYERHLRTLAAWWSLGSSAIEPRAFITYEPVSPDGLREAGL